MLKNLFRKIKGQGSEPQPSSFEYSFQEPVFSHTQSRFLDEYGYLLQPNEVFLTYLNRKTKRPRSEDGRDISTDLLDLEKFIISKLDDDFLLDISPVFKDLQGLRILRGKRSPSSIYPYLRRTENLDTEKHIENSYRESLYGAGLKTTKDLEGKGKKHLSLLLEKELLGKEFIDYVNSDLNLAKIVVKNNRGDKQALSYEDFAISPLSVHALVLLFSQYIYRAHKEHLPGSFSSQDELDYLIAELAAIMSLDKGPLFFDSLEDLSYRLRFRAGFVIAPDVKDFLLFHSNCLSYRGLSLEEFNESKDFFIKSLEDSSFEFLSFGNLKEVSNYNKPYSGGRYGNSLLVKRSFVERLLAEPEILVELGELIDLSQLRSFSCMNEVTVLCETLRAFLENRYPIFRDKKGYGSEFLDTFLFHVWVGTCKEVLEESVEIVSMTGLGDVVYKFGMTSRSFTMSPGVDAKREYLTSYLSGKISPDSLMNLPIFTGPSIKTIDLLMEYLENEDKGFLEYREDYSDLPLIDAGMLYRVLEAQL